MGDLGVSDGPGGLGTMAHELDATLTAARAEARRVDAALGDVEVSLRRWVESYRDFATPNGAAS